MSNERDRLQSRIEEAEQLRSRNDGVHNMHGAYAGVEGWMRVLEVGGKIDWENVEELLRKMRVCDRTGVYPPYQPPAPNPEASGEGGERL
jgi:hypothetical protein